MLKSWPASERATCSEQWSSARGGVGHEQSCRSTSPTDREHHFSLCKHIDQLNAIVISRYILEHKETHTLMTVDWRTKQESIQSEQSLSPLYSPLVKVERTTNQAKSNKLTANTLTSPCERDSAASERGQYE